MDKLIKSLYVKQIKPRVEIVSRANLDDFHGLKVYLGQKPIGFLLYLDFVSFEPVKRTFFTAANKLSLL